MVHFPMSWSAVLGRLISCSRNEFSADKAPLVAGRCFASSSNNSPSPTFPTSSSPQKTQPGVVGFVGLGAMGSRIALNLSRSFPLVACDTSQAAVNAFIASAAAAAAAGYPPSPPHSIAPARSVAQLFEKASELQEEGARQLSPAAVLTSLPSAAAVRAAWLGEEGLIRRAAAAASRGRGAGGEATGKRGVVALVELSTIEPRTALELSAAVDKENETSSPSPLLRFLSAPVSGGTAAAEEGTLAVLAGGPASSLRAAAPFLAPFSSRVLHAGSAPGDGDAAKLANNLALAIQMASVAEALSLASLLAPGSLTPRRMVEILNQCSGRCWSSETYPPLPELRNDYRGGFAASLMLKDLALARDAAAEAARKSSSFSSSWTPLGDAAAVAYRVCPGSDDFSSVFRHFYGGGKAAES
jgi:3-hydroxyisobutyrate dehydrogenase-like beta-hydroxyacid dehydrogenase